jgi:hypothetical protein
LGLVGAIAVSWLLGSRAGLTASSLSDCASAPHRYTPELDEKAMTALTGSWRELDQGWSLRLEEDLTRAARATTDSCQIEHVLRGQRLGRKHQAAPPAGGCGGCPHAAVAYVRGELRTPAGVAWTVTGQVLVHSASAANAYAFPYNLQLGCADVRQPCGASGTIERGGEVDLRVIEGEPRALNASARESQHRLGRLR